MPLKPKLHGTSLLPCLPHCDSSPQGKTASAQPPSSHPLTFLPAKNTSVVATVFDKMLHTECLKIVTKTEMYTLNKSSQQMGLRAFIILLWSGTFQALCLPRARPGEFDGVSLTNHILMKRPRWPEAAALRMDFNYWALVLPRKHKRLFWLDVEVQREHMGREGRSVTQSRKPSRHPPPPPAPPTSAISREACVPASS